LNKDQLQRTNESADYTDYADQNSSRRSAISNHHSTSAPASAISIQGSAIGGQQSATAVLLFTIYHLLFTKKTHP
jgi:hypothetical protein